MKLKRLLTGVLSAVMALSVCAMPAAAADATNNQVTFDPAKKTGSLTIHKYEQSQAGNNGSVTEGEGLNDVTFEAYLVATIKQEETNGSIKLTYEIQQSLKDAGLNENAFNGTETEEKTGLIKYEDVYKKVDTAFGKLTETDQEALSQGKATTQTVDGEKGIAKFDSLPLGIYMIKETKAPAQILTYTANFIVSIPMVQEGQWIYDVTAKPKNVGVYGGVSLKKTGVTVGSKTESPVADVMFQLDKKASDGTWSPVDVSNFTFTAGKMSEDTDKPANEGYVITGADGMITISSGLTKGDYRFVEISAAHGYIANTDVDANCFTVEENAGKLVTKVNGDEVSAVEVKNERPDFDKKVTKRGETNFGDNNNVDYGIGDLIPYTLTVKVPTNVAKLKTFYVTDAVNSTQLEYQNDTTNPIEVKVDNVKLDEQYYKLEVSNTKDALKIDFKTGTAALPETVAGKTITIEYKAKLLDGAAITSAGNVNKAELVYSNKTNINSSEEEQDGDKNKIHDEGVVYTFQTGILKKDPNGTKLSGVEFSFYKKYDEKTDGTLAEGAASIHFMGEDYAVITGDAAKSLGLDSKEKWIEIKANEMTDETYGNIQVKGLPAGEYYWVETKALNGYNLLKEPVKADLNVTYKAGWTEEKEFKDGVWTKHEYKMSETTYPSDKVSTPITIVNRKGFTLPVTGGFGTLLFSGIGVLLVLAGVCVLFSMKKKNNRT